MSGPIEFCPPGENCCNAEDHGHRCGLRPGHAETFHVCPCYWRWPVAGQHPTPAERGQRAAVVVLALILVALVVWAGIVLGGAR